MTHNNKIYDALPYLVDSKVGIIQYLKEELPVPGSPDFFHFSAKIASVNSFCPQENFSCSRGIAISKEKALIKAIGEGIERYCSAIYLKEKLPFYSYNEKLLTSINPDELLKCNHFNFNKTTKAHWAPTIEITNKNKITYLPASLIFLPYYFGTHEIKINYNISTGLAFHTSFNSAALSAICEVIERDAFMIFWKNRISPNKLANETLPKKVKAIIDSFNYAKQEVFLFDITTDLKIPTILAALRCKVPKNPAFVISASCKPNLEEAIISALEELELTRIYCVSNISKFNKIKNIKEIKNQNDHLAFWSNPKNYYLVNFLFQSKKFIDFKILKRKHKKQHTFDSITKYLTQKNLKIYLADLTTSDISQFNFKVVRAIIPKLHPIAFGYKNDEFVCKRLRSVPKKLGFTAKKKSRYLPHPFP